MSRRKMASSCLWFERRVVKTLASSFSLFVYYLLTPATKLGQNYVYTRVCDSVHRGGSAPLHAGIHPRARGRHPPPGSRHSPSPRTRNPSEQTPPRTRHPPGTRHSHPPGADPPAQCILGDMGNKRTARILLESNLVSNKLRGIVRASRASSWTLLPRVQCTTL